MRAGDRTRWVTALRTFERGIIAVLVVVVAVVVVLATLDLGWRLAAHVASPPVARLAVARKVIVLDLKKTPSGTLLGMAAVIFALAVAFSLQQRARRSRA